MFSHFYSKIIVIHFRGTTRDLNLILIFIVSDIVIFIFIFIYQILSTVLRLAMITNALPQEVLTTQYGCGAWRTLQNIKFYTDTQVSMYIVFVIIIIIATTKSIVIVILSFFFLWWMDVLFPLSMDIYIYIYIHALDGWHLWNVNQLYLYDLNLRWILLLLLLFFIFILSRYCLECCI